ncbi:MAG: PQQ-binding-like beta-propeller repeat protein [Actinomycetota bacterium]|nr:PQQ-binding-like beta-propeller repeat protein [Actinomycetota bacterium]
MRPPVLPLLLVVAACMPVREAAPSPPEAPAQVEAVPTTASSTTTRPSTTTTTSPPLARFVDRRTVGEPWGTVPGLLQFRGNPSRTWYGMGPPRGAPRLLWRYPESPMCGPSTVGGETTTWCGTGWTGQPVVWERPDDVTEVIFGAYDHAVHFVDGATGAPTRPSFPTGDLIKGSVTLDPDGYPLLYFGSRDNRLRVLALDRPQPTELWSLDGDAYQGIWNDDWDGNPAIVDDILFEGGENGLVFAVRLNRAYDSQGRVTVTPEVLAALPTWSDELLGAVGDRNASVESSVTLLEGTLYAANSAGRVMGIDISHIDAGETRVTLDYWMGDDVDATPVVDQSGMVYVAAELERFLTRAAEVGQLVKLDPSRPDDPRVWGLPVPPAAPDEDGGMWATPALGDGVLYVATHPGRLLVVDTGTGEVLWSDELGWHAWSSPVLVEDTLMVATCSGELKGYSVARPRSPVPLWTTGLDSESCIESTPAVWKGRIYVGARDGYLYAFGDG